jgi:hypothetical protein
VIRRANAGQTRAYDHHVEMLDSHLLRSIPQRQYF